MLRMTSEIPNILQEIVAHKKTEVAQRKELYPAKLLEKSTFFSSPCVSLKEYILREDKSGIIAKYFGGSSQDLTTARKFNYCPILRKDFIIDEYQITEAKSIGADAVLLIAEILTADEIQIFTEKAHELGLEVLCELHSEEQVEKVTTANVDLIGVNNRDLTTFNTSIENSIRIKESLPTDKVLISESGIHTTEQLSQLRNAGFHGFLIGELFMMEDNPGEAVRRFVDGLRVRG